MVHILRDDGSHICARPKEYPDVVSNMASGWFSQLVQRVLTPSALFQAGIVSLVALIVITAAGASSGRQLEPRHWLALWVAGFVVATIGAALIRLPMLLRERRDDSCSQDS